MRMAAITSPRMPRLAIPLASISPALFHEKQTLVNGDYLISQKNTLAMRFLYSTDPRVASSTPRSAEHYRGPRYECTLLQHQRGAETDYDRDE